MRRAARGAARLPRRRRSKPSSRRKPPSDDLSRPSRAHRDGARSRRRCGVVACVAPVILLVGLGATLRRLEARRLRLSRAVDFYVRGLNRLDGRWALSGEGGARFLDPEHLYAADLDVLGDSSLFELLNTARTQAGEEALAAWLLHAAPPDTVRARQQAVREIAPRARPARGPRAHRRDRAAGRGRGALGRLGRRPARHHIVGVPRGGVGLVGGRALRESPRHSCI